MSLFDMFGGGNNNTSGIDYSNSYIPENASDEYRAMMGAAPKNAAIQPSLSGMFNPQTAQQAAPAQAQPTTGSAAQAGGWNFSNGGLTQQEGIKAPTYSSAGMVYNPIMQEYVPSGGAIDPALQMTMSAGGAGHFNTGLGAFLSPMGNNAFNAGGNAALGGSTYADQDMNDLARGMGLNTGGRSGLALQSYLNDQLKDYTTIQGMSQGWNPNNDARGANATIYRNVNGQFVPVQTKGYHAREQGSYIQENPGVLAPFAVMGAGLLAGAGGAAAAGTGTATGTGTAVGTTAGATGGTAVGAGGAAAAAPTGWLGSLANYAGLGSQFSALPAYAQAGLQGAIQGGITSGISGGNPLLGAVTGGLTGGLTPGVNSALSGLGGLPAYATNALGAGGLGALSTGISGGNPLVGAIGAGVGSGVGGGLNAYGVNPQLSQVIGQLSGRTAGALASGQDLSSIFTPQNIAMLAANPRLLASLFNRA